VENLTEGDVYSLNWKEVKRRKLHTDKNTDLIKQAKSGTIQWKAFFEQID